MSSSVFPDILVVQLSGLPVDIVFSFLFKGTISDLAKNETILVENFKCRRIFVDITSSTDISII